MRNFKASMAASAMAILTVNAVTTTPVMANPTAQPTPATVDATSQAAMQGQCDALAAAQPLGQYGEDIWTGEVVEITQAITSGPTQTGTRTIVGEVRGTGIFTPAGLSIDGDPYRVGGSVNMFGTQIASAAKWSNSEYSYTANFDSTQTISFKCALSVEVYHPPVTRIISPEQYVINDDGRGGDDDAVDDRGNKGGDNERPNCSNYSDNSQPWWGEPFRPSADNPRCKFQAAVTETDPEYWDAPALISTVDGVPVTQNQTDNLPGFEANGGEITIGGDIVLGQVVVCISPTKNPGTWRLQNGYLGTKCTTTYFNSAPWGSGSRTSRGTYITVPPVGTGG